MGTTVLIYNEIKTLRFYSRFYSIFMTFRGTFKNFVDEKFCGVGRRF